MVSRTRIEVRSIPEWVNINTDELNQHYGFLKKHIVVLDEELAAGVPKAEYPRKQQVHDVVELCYDVLSQIRELI